jgi:hypothetical protein
MVTAVRCCLTLEPLGRWEEPRASFPPLMTQAADLAGSLARFVASGLRTTTAEERARRLAICQACEHFAADEGRCRFCGCVAVFAARVAGKHCPLDPPKMVRRRT